MTRSSAEQVYARREKVKKMLCQKGTTKEIAEQLGVHRRTIESDRRAIKKELLQKSRDDCFENVLTDFLLSYDDIYQKAYKMYSETKNDNVRLGSLKLMAEQERAKIPIMQSLGVIEKAADKVVISKEEELEEDIHVAYAQMRKEVMGNEGGERDSGDAED